MSPETTATPLTAEEERIARAKEEWRRRVAESFRKRPAWKRDFTTVSSAEVNPLATPDDVAGLDYARDLGCPGRVPLHARASSRRCTGAGPGRSGSSPASARPARRTSGSRCSSPTARPASRRPSTSRRSTATTPTTRCRPARWGSAASPIDTLRDFEALFDGIDLGKVTTSMTINSTAPIALAMYLAVAEKHGTPWSKVGGTLQNDILKEYIAQKEFIFPPRPSMRLVTDQFAFCAKHVPKWNTVSISGYHIREAGSTALQELAFTLRDGMEYVKYGVDAGLAVDEFAPRLSFFFNAHNDFFEEIAKYRAARRIWAKVMRDRYGAKNPESWKLRFHTQTAGVSLTAQQPYNNVARVADPGARGRPRRDAVAPHERPRRDPRAPDRVRGQDRRPDAADPRCTRRASPTRSTRSAGRTSWRRLTNRMEAGAFDYFRKIDAYGGMVEAIEAGLPAEGDHGRGLPVPAGVRRRGTR